MPDGWFLQAKRNSKLPDKGALSKPVILATVHGLTDDQAVQQSISSAMETGGLWTGQGLAWLRQLVQALISAGDRRSEAWTPIGGGCVWSAFCSCPVSAWS